MPNTEAFLYAIDRITEVVNSKKQIFGEIISNGSKGFWKFRKDTARIMAKPQGQLTEQERIQKTQAVEVYNATRLPELKTPPQE